MEDANKDKTQQSNEVVKKRMVDKNARKVKIVGYLDVVLTTSTVAFLIFITIWPVLYSNYSVNPENRYLNTTTSMEKGEKMTVEKWTFIAFVLLLGLIVTLTAIVLIQCVNSNHPKCETIKMAKFWIYCTLACLVATFVAIQYTGIQYLQNKGTFPAPCIVYFIFKLVALYVIRWKTDVVTAEQELTYKPMPGLIPEQQQQHPYMQYYRYRTQVIRNHEFGPSIPLKPYRGSGLSVPKCQCLAPQCKE